MNGDCDEKVEPVIMDLEKYKKTMQKFFEKTHANYLEENPRKTSVNNDEEDEQIPGNKKRASSYDKRIEFTSEHELLNNPTLLKFFDNDVQYLKMFILMEMQYL